MTFAAADPIAEPVVPVWREVTVACSVAAMAAAVGLAAHYEAGAAPWLALTAALASGVALWGVHSRIGRPAAPRPVKKKKVKRPATPKAENGPAETGPSLAGALGPIEAPSGGLRTTPTADRPQPVMAVPKEASPASAAAVATAAVESVMAADGASPARGAGPALAAEPVAGGDDDLERLHALIKQLSQSVEGPKASTPDPDRVLASLAQDVVAPPTSGREAPSAPSPRTWIDPLAGEASPALPIGFARRNSADEELWRRVAEAVSAERLDVLLEPIQGLADRKPRHFEVSVRFRDADGQALADGDVARAARATGLSASVDSLKLPRVALVAKRVQARGGQPADVLAGMLGQSLTDHTFMEAFAAHFTAVERSPVVLSFAQADVRAFARIHWSALATMADMGMRFALTDVTDLDMDFELLRARGFAFAKLDARLFLDGLPLGSGMIPAADICKHLSGTGLDLIVGRIDDERILEEVRRHGAMLGMGSLLGAARPVRQDILGPVSGRAA